MCTLPKATILPSKWRLGHHFPYGTRPIFSGELLVLGVGNHLSPKIVQKNMICEGQ